MKSLIHLPETETNKDLISQYKILYVIWFAYYQPNRNPIWHCPRLTYVT